MPRKRGWSRRSIAIKEEEEVNPNEEGHEGEEAEVKGEEDGGIEEKADEADATIEHDEDEDMMDEDVEADERDEEDGDDEDIEERDDEDGDDDDEEAEEREEDEDDEKEAVETNDNEIKPITIKKGRRGRPPGSSKKKKLGIAAEDDTASTTPSKKGIGRGRGTGRGRGKRFGGSSSNSQSQYVDDDGNILQVENDEFILEEDPEGEKKIDKLGYLQGGREFRVRSFTVEGRGDRLYMLSTEPARCMGFRDSYLLFQKHRKLYKLVISDREKFRLIDRDLIPHSYKGRSIGLVTARSIFREFGAKIILNGKYVTDDYYEKAAREAGYIEGQAAEVDDLKYDPNRKDQYISWNQPGTTVPMPGRELFKDPALHHLKKRKVLVTDENWKLEHSTSASAYNKSLIEKRAQTKQGIYEPHTGVKFYPQSTQPTIAIWKRISDTTTTTTATNTDIIKDRPPQVIIETISQLPNQAIRTGLKNVDPYIFETASPEIKKAILEQQMYEKQWDQLV